MTSVIPVRDSQGEIRYFRHGTVVTHWEIKHELPGRLRVKNPVIHRKAELCQAIDRELMGVLGIDYFKTNALTGTVLIQHDPRQLSRDQIIEILETCTGQRRAPDGQGQGGCSLALVHGLDTRSGCRAVRGAGALARGSRAVCLHIDPHFQSGACGLGRGKAAGRRRPGRDRRGRVPGYHGHFSRGRALLVPELWPSLGQEDAGQLEETPAERLRQAAPLCLALSRRHGGSNLTGSAPAVGRDRGQHR